jgi:uncharacterized protein (DUF983 family)
MAKPKLPVKKTAEYASYKADGMPTLNHCIVTTVLVVFSALMIVLAILFIFTRLWWFLMVAWIPIAVWLVVRGRSE